MARWKKTTSTEVTAKVTQPTRDSSKRVSKPTAKKAASTASPPKRTSKTPKPPPAKGANKASKVPAKTAKVPSKTAKAPAKTSKAPATKTSKAKAEKTEQPVSKASKKRKSDDVDHQQPASNGAKKQKASHDSEVEATVARKVLHAKTAAPKKPRVAKPKAILNHAPTKRLNVYVFGANSGGELGLGPDATNQPVKRPRLNPTLPVSSVGVVQVATGGMHCAVLTHDNKILTWGVNDDGALGRDTKWDGGLVDIDASDSGSDVTPLNPKESTPTEIDTSKIPEGTVFTQVAASDSATFALTNDGLVYGWGSFRVSAPMPRWPWSYH